MRRRASRQPELFWPRVVVRKLLNISSKDSDYSADTEDDDVSDSNSEGEEVGQWRREPRFKGNRVEEDQAGPNDGLPRIRRRMSETFRAQYISTKEVRICVGTWNVGGRVPPDDLDIDDWIDIDEPADVYVLGLQEIVPLSAGNIFGPEDSRPVLKWENIIRETLNRVQPAMGKVKCYSDPPSPSKFRPSDDVQNIEEEMLFGSGSDVGEEVHPLDDESRDFYEVIDSSVTNFGVPDYDDNTKTGGLVEKDSGDQYSSPKKFGRLNCLQVDGDESKGMPSNKANLKLTRMLSGSERMDLSWPEPPLDLLSQHVLEKSNSFKSAKAFKSFKSFKAYNSFKSVNETPLGMELLAELDLESLLKRKRRSSYVRIVSKQMVGIFITIWVRRGLRRHIQNLKVSTVGVGVMGYIGNKVSFIDGDGVGIGSLVLLWWNDERKWAMLWSTYYSKGSVSVSMSIYQTLFCFVCTHLTAGEKEGDEHRRNADVQEIHKRTNFHKFSAIGLPKTIRDHEKIFWLGDLNYRINLPYEKTRELIFKNEWSELMERDQLIRELKKGRTFDGWSEGTLNFAPTYKYEMNSENYVGEDPRAGRRTPAWCDRILVYGKGIRQLCYRRAEHKLSDHRPVTAVYMAEVEVFVPRKLQRALTFTVAELENEELISEMGI